MSRFSHKIMNKSKVTIGIFIIIGVISVFVLGLNIGRKNVTPPTVTSKDYPLLSRRIFIENPNDTRINFSGLRKELNQYFKDNKLGGTLYFEYLPTGTSVRVNPSQEFRAASLIKTPVAMELYKAAEKNLVDLDKKRPLKQEWLNSDYGELYKKGMGYELSLREAAKILLSESDNTALRMIIDATANLQIEDRALGALDIEFSQTSKNGEINIGTRSYASFFKCLYFACYNTKEHSQEILDYLTQSKFDNRLTAGINNDKNIKIAHKIGVFNTQVQSDCGIVYVENKNYVLCIMLEGDDTPETNTHIAELSRRAYDFIITN